jgi:integrase
VIKKKARTLTPHEYDAILAALPAQHRLMVETAINTGLRWGELIALSSPPPRSRHRGTHRRGDHR